MGFQILDSQGKAIPINKLDEEACALWGKEVDPRNYAFPKIKPEKFSSFKEEFDFFSDSLNWFDKIGYKIHLGNQTWEGLKQELLDPFKDLNQEELKNYLPLYGHIRLIELWEQKGYTPKQVNT